MFKKNYSMIFILFIGAMAFAQTPKAYDCYPPEFQVALTKDGKGCIITKCISEGYDGNCGISIPDTIEDLPVKEIGKEAFKNAEAYYIYLPNTLEKIDDSAFWNCKNLQSIEIPNSVKSIGVTAFRSTSSLKEIKFHSREAKIYNLAFAQSGIRNLTIKGNVIFIEDDGFLTDSKGGIHGEPFYACDNLETVTIEADVEEIPSSFLTSKTLKTVVFKAAETIVSDSSFRDCPNLSLASQAAIKQHIKENNTAYQAKIKAQQDAEQPKIEKAIVEYIDKNGFCEKNNILRNINCRFNSVKEEVFDSMLSSGKIYEEERGYYITPQKRKSLLAEAEKKVEEMVKENGLHSMYSFQYNKLLGDNLEFVREEAIANVLQAGKICEVQTERKDRYKGMEKATYLAIPGTYPSLLAKAEKDILEYVQACEKCNVNFTDDYNICKNFDNSTYILMDIAIVNLLKSNKIIKYDDKSSRNSYYATPEKYAENLAKERAEEEKLLADVENAIVEYVQEHGPCRCNSQIDDIRVGHDYDKIEIDGHSYYVKKIALENAVKSGRLVEYQKGSSSNPYYATPEKYAELKKSAEGKNIIDKNDELMAEAEMEIYAFITRNINKFKKEEILERINSKYDSVKEKAFTNLEEKGKIGANKNGVYRYWLQ